MKTTRLLTLDRGFSQVQIDQETYRHSNVFRISEIGSENSCQIGFLREDAEKLKAVLEKFLGDTQ